MSKFPQIIAVNGPPRSGKGFLTNLIHEEFYAVKRSCVAAAFSDPLYDAISKMYGLSSTTLDQIINSNAKDLPNDFFFGKTLREVAISLSEDWLKRFHNDRSIFSKLLATRLRRTAKNGHTIVLDTGFYDEFFPFITEIAEHVPELEQVTLIRIHRKGCSFENDSRHYITNEMVKEYNQVAKAKVVDFDYYNDYIFDEDDIEGSKERMSEFYSIVNPHLGT